MKARPSSSPARDIRYNEERRQRPARCRRRGVVAIVRQNIGPVAALKRVVTVDRLPKTRSGKILRSTIKKILDGEPVVVPSTIEDPAVLAEIERVLRS